MNIVPIARPFFTLCDLETSLPLNPYHTLSSKDIKKHYQLRVFVNTGENGSRFLRTSKQAYGYYYRQVSWYGRDDEWGVREGRW